MGRSLLRSKWMQMQYAEVDANSYFRRNMENPSRNPHRLDKMPKNGASKYIVTHCNNDLQWLQECSGRGYGISKAGHRIVSGIVRAKAKKEWRDEIENELCE